MLRGSLKYIVVGFMAFALLLAPILCCCLTESAHAEEVHSKAEHCHKDHSTGSKKTHTCDCAKMQGAFDQQELRFVQLKEILNPITFHLSLLEGYHSFDIAHIRVHEHSPPGLYTKSIPLYLRHSILRI